MIIGKSSINSEFFDILIFCFRNVEKVTIPNFIRVIDSYSFNRCKQLKTVEIPFDSNLQEIKKKAFFNSSIEMFTIPSHLTSIEEGAFCFCEKLKSIEIPSDSKLKTIKKKALKV